MSDTDLLELIETQSAELKRLREELAAARAKQLEPTLFQQTILNERDELLQKLAAARAEAQRYLEALSARAAGGGE